MAKTLEAREIIKNSSIDERAALTKTPQGRKILAALSPTELAQMFPEYFKENQNSGRSTAPRKTARLPHSQDGSQEPTDGRPRPTQPPLSSGQGYPHKQRSQSPNNNRQSPQAPQTQGTVSRQGGTSGSASRSTSSTTPLTGRDSPLAQQRARYGSNMSPEDKLHFYATVLSESRVGDGANGRRSIMETVYNRAAAHNANSIFDPNYLGRPGQPVNRKGDLSKYYEPLMRHSRGYANYQKNLDLLRRNPALMRSLEEDHEAVLAGSNHSNFGTQNASAGVAARARETQTVTSQLGDQISRKDRMEHAREHGEQYTREEGDWFRRMQQQQQAWEQSRRNQQTAQAPTDAPGGEAQEGSVGGRLDMPQQEAAVASNQGSAMPEPQQLVQSSDLRNNPRLYDLKDPRDVQPGEYNWGISQEGRTALINPDNPDRSKLVSLKTTRGQTFQVHQDVADRAQGFVNELESGGYTINSIGGYSHRRNVNNPRAWSTHASGGTLDINPEQNPNQPRSQGSGQRRTDLPDNIEDLAAKWGFSWGGGFGDAMHFETMSPALRRQRLEDLARRGVIKPDDIDGYFAGRPNTAVASQPRPSATAEEIQASQQQQLADTRNTNPFLRGQTATPVPKPDNVYTIDSSDIAGRMIRSRMEQGARDGTLPDGIRMNDQGQIVTQHSPEELHKLLRTNNDTAPYADSHIIPRIKHQAPEKPKPSAAPAQSSPSQTAQAPATATPEAAPAASSPAPEPPKEEATEVKEMQAGGTVDSDVTATPISETPSGENLALQGPDGEVKALARSGEGAQQTSPNVTRIVPEQRVNPQEMMRRDKQEETPHREREDRDNQKKRMDIMQKEPRRSPTDHLVSLSPTDVILNDSYKRIESRRHFVESGLHESHSASNYRWNA